MKKYLFLILILFLSCSKKKVEVFPTVDLQDTTLTLIFRNNTNKRILLNKIVSLSSNYKSTNPEYKNSIETVNLYDREIRLQNIHPYTQEYTEIMKNNFDYAYRGFPNFRDSIPDYLKSMLIMNDPITIINKEECTMKKYKIRDYEINDKSFKIKIINNSTPIKFKSKDLFLYKENLIIHPIKIR